MILSQFAFCQNASPAHGRAIPALPCFPLSRLREPRMKSSHRLCMYGLGTDEDGGGKAVRRRCWARDPSISVVTQAQGKAIDYG